MKIFNWHSPFHEYLHFFTKKFSPIFLFSLIDYPFYDKNIFLYITAHCPIVINSLWNTWNELFHFFSLIIIAQRHFFLFELFFCVSSSFNWKFFSYKFSHKLSFPEHQLRRPSLYRQLEEDKNSNENAHDSFRMWFYPLVYFKRVRVGQRK